ncbi:MAG: AI-2E family transporter [Eubacteriales bacterium]
MNDNDKNNAPKSPLTPNAIFFLAVKLVAFGIILYVLLTHINDITAIVGGLFSLISPLLIGSLVALILNTPMMSIERLLRRIADKTGRKIRRRTCEIASLILTFAAALLIIYILAYSIVPQLADSVKAIYLKAQANLPQFLEWLKNLENYGINTDPIIDWINKIDINELIKNITENVMNIISALTSSVSSIISGASSIISGVVKGVTSVIFAVYILSNKSKLKRQVKEISYAYIKKERVDRAGEICALIIKTFANFFSGQCLEAIILGLLFFISMSVFGFSYPLAISSLIAVTAIIPYIGAFIGCFFGMLLIVIDDPIRAVWFLIMFLIIQQIENNLIYPRVVGGSVGLPAIWTFTAVIVGGGLFGVVGMILFIPLFSVLYTLLRENVHSRLDARGIDIPHEADEDEPAAKKKRDLGGKVLTHMQSLVHSLNDKSKKPPSDDDEGNNMQP